MKLEIGKKYFVLDYFDLIAINVELVEFIGDICDVKNLSDKEIYTINSKGLFETQEKCLNSQIYKNRIEEIKNNKKLFL